MTLVFEFIQSLTGISMIDQIMIYMAEWLVLLVPLVMIYLWFFGKEGKKDSLFSFLTAVLGVLISYGLSALYFHENPSASYETIVAPKPENAFPSQHTAVMFATALPLLWRERRGIGTLMLVSGVLTGFSRVYIGEHWPLDILGSLLAAMVAVAVVYFLSDHFDYLVEEVAERSQRIEDDLLR